MSDLIPISAKMVGDTGYRKMYLARHVEKRIAAFEARVAELETLLNAVANPSEGHLYIQYMGYDEWDDRCDAVLSLSIEAKS